MFKKLFQYFNRIKTINKIDSIIKNDTSFKQTNYRDYTTAHSWQRVWNFPKFDLVQFRTIRSDLIEVKSKDGSEIASWVDQSHQYSGFLGKNDIIYHNIDLFNTKLFN